MDANNKRPLDDGDDGCHDNKKPKVALLESSNSSIKPSSHRVLGIEDLYDDVIIHIFKYLSNDNLAKMSLVCPTLSRVSKDWTLWKNVRFDQFDKSMEDLYLDCFQECTSHITIIGTERPTYDASATNRFLLQLESRSPELSHLTLKKQKFDATKVSIKFFHPRLKSLTFERTVIKKIPENAAYLNGINNTCPELEEIRMLFNDWFMPHCLYALAKLENLTYLSLQGCRKFKDCIPYASITTITGFKSLRTLDLRLTPISDHELVCFQRLKNLKHVLLESPEYVNHEGDATITDLGLSGFCHNSYEFQYPYIQILIDRDGDVNMRRIGARDDHSDKCSLENLYVRNYPRVTDAFLKCAAKTCESINFLDVTGTSCTLNGIARYKVKKPDVTIVY